jgi:hypothetical protein
MLMSDGVLTIGWRNRLLKKLGCSELLCYRCHERIRIGSKIHTNNPKVLVPGRSRIYHARCFRKMFL